MARIEISAPVATEDQKKLAVYSALKAVTEHGFDAWTASRASLHIEEFDRLNTSGRPPTPTLMKAVEAWFALRSAIEQVCGQGADCRIHPDAGDLGRKMPWPPLIVNREP